MSAIDSGRIAKTYHHAVKQHLPDYMGLIFEKMCQDYLLYYSDNLPIELSEILIRDYASVFGQGSNYYYYIFSKGGFTDGLLQAQERGEVKLITLEDLYSS